MKNINLTSVLKCAKDYVSKNQSKLCTGAGIALSIGSTAAAVWGTIKAVRKADNVKNETAKKIEVVKEVWYYYIPAIATEAFAVLFFIGAQKSNDKQNAALAAAYSLTSTAFREYKEKVKETIGEKKEESIRDEIIKDKIESHQPSSREIIVASNGDTLFYDVLSDRYFTSDVNSVRKAVNKINREMLSENNIALNELYYELGLNGVKIGEELGWRIEDGYIDIRFSGQITEDERACLALEFNIPPQYDFQKLY